jgi:hypothetical protein
MDVRSELELMKLLMWQRWEPWLREKERRGLSKQVRSGLGRRVWIGSGPDRLGIGTGEELVLPSGERLGDCPVLLRGYFIMQQTARRPPSPAKPRISTRCSLCLLAVCFQSSPRLDLHLPYWNGRPFVHPFTSHPVCLPAGGEWD